MSAPNDVTELAYVWLSLTRISSVGARHGLGGQAPKMSLGPTVKHTGQESEGEFCEIFKY